MPADDAPDPVRDVVIAMIVAHALDDLEAEHVDLPTVLTLTALAGWREAERSTGRPRLSPGETPGPGEPDSPADPLNPAEPRSPRPSGRLPEPRDEP